MKRHIFKGLRQDERTALTKRPASTSDREVTVTVRAIIEDVSLRGDEALKSYTQQFDGVTLNELFVKEEEFQRAEQLVPAEVKNAIACATKNIDTFHRTQFPQPITVQTMSGVVCRREWRPQKRIGFYVPGGTAPLFSTVLMLGIPARIAGCQEIILCTPPTKLGSVAPEILFASQSVGISNVFKVGGAQAIAAMAIGTTSISKVDKIFGPGNRYVSIAKSIVAQPPYSTAIDLTAGPSELLIVADDSANPVWVAADLLSQAEHGEGSQVVLVTSSGIFADNVERELDKQLKLLPRQQGLRTALEKSFALVVSTIDEAIEFANMYAPEHLELCIIYAETHAKNICNAGSVFVGPMSSVVFGDYASGTNHTLPTGGAATTVGGVTVESFMKSISFQTLSPSGFSSLAETVKVLARAEGLEAHAQAVVRREEHA
jgi:histidinol dehydrogenase